MRQLNPTVPFSPTDIRVGEMKVRCFCYLLCCLLHSETYSLSRVSSCTKRMRWWFCCHGILQVAREHLPVLIGRKGANLRELESAAGASSAPANAAGLGHERKAGLHAALASFISFDNDFHTPQIVFSIIASSFLQVWCWTWSLRTARMTRTRPLRRFVSLLSIWVSSNKAKAACMRRFNMTSLLLTALPLQELSHATVRITGLESGIVKAQGLIETITSQVR